MLEKLKVPIARIRVPAKRVKTLNAQTVQEIAESICDIGQSTPIRVRTEGDGYILVEGFHRLEALKALGEDTIEAFLVRAQLH